MKTILSKSSLFGYLLAASLVLSSCPTYTIDLPSPKTAAITAGGVALGLSFLKLYKKKPETHFVPHYPEIAKNLTENLRTKQVTRKEIKDFFRLIYCIYNELFVGQTSSTSKVRANKDRGDLEISESADAYGILGNANEFFRPLKSAAEALGALFFVYKLSTSEKFSEALFGVVEKKSQSAV